MIYKFLFPSNPIMVYRNGVIFRNYPLLFPIRWE